MQVLVRISFVFPNHLFVDLVNPDIQKDLMNYNDRDYIYFRKASTISNDKLSMSCGYIQQSFLLFPDIFYIFECLMHFTNL